jgi:hypothetical protein
MVVPTFDEELRSISLTSLISRTSSISLISNQLESLPMRQPAQTYDDSMTAEDV